jgi:predicted SprT family Zn-dependent metalloprotease
LAFKPEELTDEELNQLLEQLEESDEKPKPEPESPESDFEAAGKSSGSEYLQKRKAQYSC